MSDVLLQLRGVRKSFGGVVANDDIDLDIERGSIVGLIGPNGSGKTTLFNSIVGFHALEAGSVCFDGQVLNGLSPAEVARLGLVRTFQQAHVYDGLTCERNLLVSVSHAGERVRDLVRKVPPQRMEKAAALLDLVGLRAKRDVIAGELSYGQRKLLEFAMALMSDPKMILLDEPTAGINPTLINAIVDRLRYASAAFGTTLLVIEHNMRVIMNLAEHVYCLAHGRMLASGSPQQVRTDPLVIEAYLGAR